MSTFMTCLICHHKWEATEEEIALYLCPQCNKKVNQEIKKLDIAFDRMNEQLLKIKEEIKK